jgi:hypothetical protein
MSGNSSINPSCSVTKVHNSTYDRFRGIVLFDISDHANIVFDRVVELDFEPRKIAFDSKGDIWMVTDSPETPVAILSATENYNVLKSGKKLDSINTIKPEEKESKFDHYEISKMRKWSQWNPADKNNKRKEKVVVDSAKKKQKS